ncbi:DNA cytosine methyltransferase [Burkholderia sp. BCC1644]|uniref:DNA cytosine methyltransferase n=1 Tax=Burkholderia sp. BCC1644 TaxID=2676293 RepID=UPI001591536C|nr:DNA cytosine methyltransferase [Burkholderia sp. BCC1644]
MHKPKVIDLFAGVGGLSLGAARAGFEVAGAVELDRIAVTTHALNFPNSRHIDADVGALTGSTLLQQCDLRSGEVAGLIGGPPCQGFSEIGKKNAADPRNQLLGHFFRLVSEIRPAFFIAENVPGVLAERNSDIVQAALARVPRHYVLLDPTLLVASTFGAATTRKRCFFVGFDPMQMDDLSGDIFVPGAEVIATTVGDAFAGLPSVRADWGTEQQSWRRVGRLPDTFFHRSAQERVPDNVGEPTALERYTVKGEVSGCFGTVHEEATIERFRKLRPGAKDPVSRAMRLSRDGLCPTLRAGTGAERGSFQAVRPIHYGSPRVITPREAARIQGFPDWFTFHPTKWHSFRQIGNSVSPLLAESVLAAIKRKLR